MGKKIKNAFTLVELMVVIAILAILTTVSIVGYKSFIRKERINSALTEATQAQEIIISKIVADRDGIVEVPYGMDPVAPAESEENDDTAMLPSFAFVVSAEEGDEEEEPVISGSITCSFTYEAGFLNIVFTNPVSSVTSFNTNIRKVFSGLASLPGVFSTDGEEVYYHSSPVLDPDEDIIVNIRTLEYTTPYGESGNAGGEGGGSESAIKIKVGQTNLILQEKQTRKIGFSVLPEGTAYKWTSGNPEIATVDQDGNVTGVKLGKTFVKLEAGGMGRTVTVNVSPLGRTPVRVPSQDGRLTYNPDLTSQTPKWLNYDSSIMSVELTPQKEPGYYQAIFTLKDPDRYCWADDYSNGTKTVNWWINKIPVPLPYQKGRLEYGQISLSTLFTKKTPEWSNYDTSVMRIIEDGSVMSSNVPGKYNVYFELLNPDYYVWADGKTTDGKEVNRRPIEWELSKHQIPKPYLSTTSYEYKGPNQSTGPKDSGFKNYDQSLMTISDGVTQGISAGDYYTTFSIQVDKGLLQYILEMLDIEGDASDFYEWEHKVNEIGSSEPITIDWKITKKKIAVPRLTTNTYKFDGQSHTVGLSGYDTTWMKGNTAQTNVGNYTTKIELKDTANTTWADGTTGAKEYKWSITVADLSEWPTRQTNTLRYDGTEKTATFDNFDSNKLTVTGNKATAVGTYTATFKTTPNYVFSDGSESKTVQWTIGKGQATVPTLATKSYTYTGIAITPKFTYNSNMIGIREGTGSGTIVGTYTTTFYLLDKDSCEWSTGGNVDKTISWTITPASINSDPTARTNLTYNGTEQLGINNYIDNSMSIVSGQIKATNAGNYSVTLAIDANHKWKDGTTGNKTINWSIAKKSLTVPSVYVDNTQSNSVNYDGKEHTPKLNPASSTEWTASGDTGAKTQVGTYTITVSLNNTTNYQWSNGGGTNDKTINWSISKKSVTAPSAKSNLQYTGEGQIVVNNFDSTYMEVVSGSITQTNAGSGSVTIKLKDKTNSQWSNGGGTNDKTINWSISKKSVTVPTVSIDNTGSSSITSDEKSHTPKLNPASSTEWTASGDTGAKTQVGTYKITVSLNNTTNYQWSSGDTKDKTLTWEIKEKSECFTADTLITMADGTKKRVDQLSVGEEILTFDHVAGKVSASPVAYIFKSHLMYDITKLYFANDTEITVLQAHCFYNAEENKYVEINKNNVGEYLHKHFYCMDTNSYVELVDYEISRDYMDAYSVLSAYDINHVANGMLAVSDEIEGLFNYFDYDENMKYDEVKMQEDIATYGLVEYDMFKDYCTEEEFEVFNCKYLGIAVGKGLTTYESLIERMQRFSGNSN